MLPRLESLRTNSVYIPLTALIPLLPSTIQTVKYCDWGWNQVEPIKKARKGDSTARSIERQLAEVLGYLQSPAGAGALPHLVRLKLGRIHWAQCGRLETGEARAEVAELRGLLRARSGASLELVPVWQKKVRQE